MFFVPYLIEFKEKYNWNLYYFECYTKSVYNKAISSDQNMIGLAPPDLAFVTLPINNTLVTTQTFFL